MYYAGAAYTNTMVRVPLAELAQKITKAIFTHYTVWWTDDTDDIALFFVMSGNKQLSFVFSGNKFRLVSNDLTGHLWVSEDIEYMRACFRSENSFADNEALKFLCKRLIYI